MYCGSKIYTAITNFSSLYRFNINSPVDKTIEQSSINKIAKVIFSVSAFITYTLVLGINDSHGLRKPYQCFYMYRELFRYFLYIILSYMKMLDMFSKLNWIHIFNHFSSLFLYLSLYLNMAIRLKNLQNI